MVVSPSPLENEDGAPAASTSIRRTELDIPGWYTVRPRDAKVYSSAGDGCPLANKIQTRQYVNELEQTCDHRKEPSMRRRNHKVNKLARIELLRDCRRRELELLATVTDEVMFRPGETLCTEGRGGSEVFMIAAGDAEVHVGGEAIAVVGPGEVVGEMALVDGGPRTASVIARTDVHTFAIEARRFSHVLERAPAVARAMLRQMSERLRRLDANFGVDAFNRSGAAVAG